MARRFGWRGFRKSLDAIDGEPVADAPDVDERVRDCVVVFAHAEAADQNDASRRRAFQQTLKHVKWLANKRDLRRVVLHSFTHLGADSAAPGFARDLLQELAERLANTGYEVHCTPFAHQCEWQLDVYGDSLAKVYKQI